MRKLVVTEFITLDGVMEDPGGAEKFERGGWAFQFERGPEGDKFKKDELLSSDAMLLGRVTYQGFEAAWPSRTGEFADKMNNMNKYVVTSSLSVVGWNNSNIIKNSIIDEVKQLKEMEGKDILVAGSRQLVQKLMEYDLVDELRLMVFPIILGKGKRLFDNTTVKHPLELAEANPVGSAGVVTLVYRAKPAL
jgi:dihydrofolate reductase